MFVTAIKNNFKIDNNCRYSFSKAKKDIYQLINAVKKQQEMIEKLAKEQSSRTDFITLDQFTHALDAVNYEVRAVDQRITDVHEYAENLKASVTRMNSSLKKMKDTQTRLVKMVSKKDKGLIRKVESLDRKIAQKEEEIKKVKSNFNELSKKVTASKNAVAKLSKKSARTLKSTGGKSKMKDHNLVNVGEDHEMKYILKKYEKRQTQDNVEAIRSAIKKFKATHKNDDRADIYRFLESSDVLEALA